MNINPRIGPCRIRYIIVLIIAILDRLTGRGQKADKFLHLEWPPKPIKRDLLRQGGYTGREARGLAGAAQHRSATAKTGAADLHAGRKDIHQRSVALAQRGNAVWGGGDINRAGDPEAVNPRCPNGANGNDIRIGRRIGHTRCAVEGIKAIPGCRDDQNVTRRKGCQLIANAVERSCAVPILIIAHRKVNDADIVSFRVVQRPLQGCFQLGEGTATIRVEYTQRDNIRPRGDATIGCVLRGNDAGDMGPMAKGIIGIRIIIHKVILIGDTIRDAIAIGIGSKEGMVCINAAIHDNDANARARDTRKGRIGPQGCKARECGGSACAGCAYANSRAAGGLDLHRAEHCALITGL